MTPAAIFLFLTGAVLARRFRVWILVPVSLAAVFVTVPIQLSLGASSSAAVGYGLLIGIAPQLGYMFGMMAYGALLAYSMQHSPSRTASVASLYKRASVDHS